MRVIALAFLLGATAIASPVLAGMPAAVTVAPIAFGTNTDAGDTSCDVRAVQLGRRNGGLSDVSPQREQNVARRDL